MNPLDLAGYGPVIPVIVIDRLEDAVPMARALVAGGVRVLEVTLRTAAGLPAIEAIAREVPDAVVGAGTVRNAADARAAKAASAAEISTFQFAKDSPTIRIWTSSQRTTLMCWSSLRKSATSGAPATAPAQSSGPFQSPHSTPEW